MRGGRPRASKLRTCRKAGPAMEFALICPALVAMLLGAYDLSEGVITMRRLAAAAQEIALAASTFASSGSAPGVETTTQGYQAMSIGAALFPQWTPSQGSAPFWLTLTSVAMIALPANCASGCTWSAQTAWSIGVAAGQTVLRPCGALQAVPDGQATSPSTLPAGLLTPPSILVADASMIYAPLFSTFLTGPIRMTRSAYVPPRLLGSKAYVTLKADSSYVGDFCPGF